MTHTTKRQKEIVKAVDKKKKYILKEAVSVLKNVPHPKFDETITISFRVNIDQKEAPQSVRSTVALPHGTGKKVRVAVFCKGETVNEAKAAGADFIGANDLIDKIAAAVHDFFAGGQTIGVVVPSNRAYREFKRLAVKTAAFIAAQFQPLYVHRKSFRPFDSF